MGVTVWPRALDSHYLLVYFSAALGRRLEDRVVGRKLVYDPAEHEHGLLPQPLHVGKYMRMTRKDFQVNDSNHLKFNERLADLRNVCFNSQLKKSYSILWHIILHSN